MLLGPEVGYENEIKDRFLLGLLLKFIVGF